MDLYYHVTVTPSIMKRIQIYISCIYAIVGYSKEGDILGHEFKDSVS